MVIFNLLIFTELSIPKDEIFILVSVVNASNIVKILLKIFIY